jgi:leader peptidase (prepilin peptidase) / N-methyltransferase
MVALTAVCMFVIGAALGSFVTVASYRLPRGEGFVRGRSYCTACGAPIAAYDNVPILSWLWLRGRCRRCGSRISLRYPLTELSLAMLLAATTVILGIDDLGPLILGLVLCAVLVAITVTDLERRIIPNAFVGFGALAAVAIVAISDPSSLPENLLAGAAGGAGLLLVALAYPRGMGMGDVKLVAMMGLYLGRSLIPALFIGFASGALVGVGLIAARGSSARKQAIPFGPFLALGGVVALWAGDALIDWYTDTFSP